MLNELNEDQIKLAEYMAELSETAYSAGWMTDLEFALWDGMNNKIADYGRLTFNEQIREKLKVLSNECSGWIIFDNKKEETFVNWKEWNKLKK